MAGSHSGIGTRLSAADLAEQGRIDALDAQATEETRQRDQRFADAEGRKIVAVWEHNIRVRIDQLLIVLAEKTHPDAERAKWLQVLRSALADAKEGLRPAP